MRYRELKYDGKTYNESYKIDEILLKNEFDWILDAEIEDARLEITKGIIVFNAGKWYSGTWEFGAFRNGTWYWGTWNNGVFFNGIWRNGLWKDGIIINGKFIQGKLMHGEIRGGTFVDCEITAGVKRTDEQEKLNRLNDDSEIQ